MGGTDGCLKATGRLDGCEAGSQKCRPSQQAVAMSRVARLQNNNTVIHATVHAD